MSKPLPAVKLANSSVGRYQMLELIGRGGLGVVYRAQHPDYRWPHAVKVMLPEILDGAFKARFLDVMSPVLRLSHRNLVPVHDAFVADGFHCVAMDHMEGGNLRDRIASPAPHGSPPARAHPALTWAKIVIILSEISRALDYIHEQGLCHGNVKPSKILFGSDGRAMLGDVATVHLFGGMPYTPLYSAPERQHFDREPDAMSDTYSLGVVVYEMATGTRPFEGDRNTPQAIMQRQLTQRPPFMRDFRPDTPAALEFQMLKALSDRPSDRFQSAGELAAAFNIAIQRSGVLSRPATSLAVEPTTPPAASDRLGRIRDAIKAGDVDRARSLLRTALKNPTAETYYLASQVALNEQQRQDFLRTALELDPKHKAARKAMKRSKQR